MFATYSLEPNPIELCCCVIKTYLCYSRNTLHSEDIIQAFVLLDHELIANEYLRSAEYLLLQPFTQPPNLQAILDFWSWHSKNLWKLASKFFDRVSGGLVDFTFSLANGNE
jgi:hypothetical protein